VCVWTVSVIQRIRLESDNLSWGKQLARNPVRMLAKAAGLQTI